MVPVARPPPDPAPTVSSMYTMARLEATWVSRWPKEKLGASVVAATAHGTRQANQTAEPPKTTAQAWAAKGGQGGP